MGYKRKTIKQIHRYDIGDLVLADGVFGMIIDIKSTKGMYGKQTLYVIHWFDNDITSLNTTDTVSLWKENLERSAKS